jgi:type III secretion protein V
VYLLDPKVEERLEQPLPLSRDDRSALLRALTEEIGSLPPTAQNPVILTTASVRLRLRREMGADFPRTAVLAYQELSPDMNIQPIARIEAPDLTNPS